MTLMEWWLAFGGVLLLGFQSSISPCPLATNIAAISYIGRRVSKPREVLLSGFLYMFGRTLAYFALAFCVLCIPIFSGDQVTRYFSVTVGIFLGPMMIVIGMILLGLLNFSIPSVHEEVLTKIVDRLGIWSAFPLGIIFALAFCPTTAAMFLGMLTLAAKTQSWFLFPLSFGISSTLPFLVLAGVLAYQIHFLSKILNTLQNIDMWMRNITGVLFIVLGIYLSILHNFS